MLWLPSSMRQGRAGDEKDGRGMMYDVRGEIVDWKNGQKYAILFWKNGQNVYREVIYDVDLEGLVN